MRGSTVQAASRVGGAWRAPVDLSAGQDSPFPQSQAGVAMDAGGDAIAVWTRASDAPLAFVTVAATRPAEGTWSAPVNLSAAGLRADDVSVRANAGGEAVATWSIMVGAVYFVQAAIYLPGRGWQPTVTLSDPGSDSFTPRAAINTRGDVVVAWEHGSALIDRVQAVTLARGGTWTPPHDLSPPYTGGAVVALDPGGSAFVAWIDYAHGPSFVQGTVRPAGGAWQPPVRISTTGETASAPAIAVDAHARAIVLWEDANHGHDIVRSASRPQDGPWGPPTDLSSPAVTESDMEIPNVPYVPPDLAMDPRGDAVAIWDRSNGRDDVIQSALRPAGGRWEAPARLSALGEDAVQPHLAIDPDGRTLAIWDRALGNVNDVVQAASTVVAPASGSACCGPRRYRRCCLGWVSGMAPTRRPSRAVTSRRRQAARSAPPAIASIG